MEHFRITYDGEGLVNHEMDVKLLAPALIAVGELLENANRVLNHGQTKVVVNVRGSLKTGSVAIDFSTVQTIYNQVIDFLTGKEITAAVTILAFLGLSAKDGKQGVLQAIKWLKGRKISRFTLEDSVVVIYVDDEMLIVEEAVFELLKDYELRRSYEKVLEPLEHNGIDKFVVSTDTVIVEVVEKSERFWFVAPPPAEQRFDPSVYEETLQIERIEFDKDNKWRFTDGSAQFYAVITDKNFLDRIANGDAVFAASDTLRVRIKKTQSIELGKLKNSYEIIEVLDHRKTQKQIALDF